LIAFLIKITVKFLVYYTIYSTEQGYLQNVVTSINKGVEKQFA